MERARTAGSDRNAALRRVAIVLSSLPGPVASKLLDDFDPESRRSLRHAMTSLSDVDPLERKRALQAFKGSLSRPASAVAQRDDGVGDEISLDSAEGQGTRRTGSRVVPSSSLDPTLADRSAAALAFLADVDDDALVGMLRGEHPQTIALVLASIAPEQAARVLPNLDAALQGEALSRIGRLGETPPDVVDEIASHLRARIRQAETTRRSETGQRALGAILAAMPRSPAAPHHRPAVADPDSETNSSHPVGPARDRYPGSPLAETNAQPSDDRAAELSALDQTHRLRLVTSEWHEQDDNWETNDQSPAEADSNATVLQSTDAIHRYLLELSAEDLCEALGKVTTRQAILTLCGLPNETASAVLSVLPRSQARQVRRGMASLQSLELREIDDAKEAVANASTQTHGLAENRGNAPLSQSSVRMAA